MENRRELQHQEQAPTSDSKRLSRPIALTDNMDASHKEGRESARE